MMQLKGLVGLAACGLFVMMAPSAHATIELTLNDGLGHLVDVSDGGAGDSCVAANCVTFNGSVGDWNINVDTGTDGLASSPNVMDLSFNAHHAASSTASTLTIELSDTGFTGTGVATEIGGTQNSGGTTTFRVWDGTNKFDTTNPVIALETFTGSPFSMAGGGATPGASHSLTEILTITFGTAAGQATGDAALAPVPEPSSIVLFGVVLLGCTTFLKRRFGSIS